jgi:hypothetical protein
MLTFNAGGSRLCDGLTRREILRVGSLGVLGTGLNLGGLLGAEATGPSSIDPGFGRA